MWDHSAPHVGGQIFGPVDAPLALTPDWTGPLPPTAVPKVLARRGVALNPFDPQADRLRLLAYLWADQPDRLESRLQTPHEDALHLVFHTIAWQYFPAATQARAMAALAKAGAMATSNAPIARLGMEADGTTPAAGITLAVWPGGETIPLGRADFHGRWVIWSPPA